MRCLINYQLRLGDIVACLPIAKFLAGQGHEIFWCCRPEYHAIFQTISYARPVLPREFEENREEYDKVYDLQIRRGEYDKYRESGVAWRDYVFGKYPEFAKVKDERPVFDQKVGIKEYNLPGQFTLVAPYGISQTYRVRAEWVIAQAQKLGKAPYYVLGRASEGKLPAGVEMLEAKTIAHLPGLIAAATTFVTINSAPNAIAAGVREKYYHVYEEGFGGQNNVYYPQQERLKAPSSEYYASWRHVANEIRYKLVSFLKPKKSVPKPE